MIRKLLIANRGEIVCRIVRTCHEMGIATVAVYSDADRKALHVEMADEAVHIGASPAAESYLNGQKIIDAAKCTHADAIHPGYGFLAENADFAQAVLDAGLTFIGPSPQAIAAMGKKRESKLILKDIPLVSGYMDADQSDVRLIVEAQEIGFPLMVKASAGGGGKGMRQVYSAHDLPAELHAARREALQAFGDDTLLLERLVTKPRHIEVQIFGDKHGGLLVIGDRECTIQRRYQKIIEESPSPGLSSRLRRNLYAAAIRIGKQLAYDNAGTVEFLVDADQNYYFMEMNTRLQVEHPVTEETTGLDLVRWQIMVAEGHSLTDLDVYPAGHAIEVRIYAEDPAKEFLPVTGDILRWQAPPDVRVDSGIRSGDQVSVYYDPMLAKITAYGEHRAGAIRRLDYALGQLQLLGIRSNVAFLRRVLMHPDHLAANITTSFIPEHPELLSDTDEFPRVALIAASLAKTLENTGTQGHWRNNPYRPIRQFFRIGEVEHEVSLTSKSDSQYSVTCAGSVHQVRMISFQDGDMVLEYDGLRQPVTVVHGQNDAYWVHLQGFNVMFQWIDPLPQSNSAREADGSLRAPMPGQVIAVLIEAGKQVQKGDVLLVLEAMKMEHRIRAPYDGQVIAVKYQVGQSVQAAAVLLEIQEM